MKRRPRVTPTSAPAREARPVPLGAMLVLALGALLLRAWHLDHGLPDFAEEAFPFRHALSLWGAGGTKIDLNPHWFLYPSFTIYVQFALQQLLFRAGSWSSPADFLLRMAADPTQAVTLGRWVGVAADVVTLMMTARITSRLGRAPAILSMMLVAFSPRLILTARSIYADGVLCAFTMAAVERMLAYQGRGGRGRLIAAGVLVGLAAGAKYPGAALIVPLGMVVLQRERGRPAVTACLTGCVAAGAAFLCTSPFILSSWPEFVSGAVYLRDAETQGALGGLGGPAALHYLAGLPRDLGWAGATLAAVSLLGLWRGSQRKTTQLLWVAWAVMTLPVASVPVEAERYLVPSVALTACLAAAGGAMLLEHARAAAGAFAPALLVLVCSVQPAWSGLVAAMAGRDSTAGEARRWCEAHLEDTDVILSEAYGPSLLTFGRRAEVMASDLFRSASRARQAAYASQRAYHLAWMPLLVGGYASVRLPTRIPVVLDVYPHAVDWNAAVYDVRLLRGIHYVVTTAAVRGRFEADPARFREQARFYAFLDTAAEKAAVFAPDREVEGPRISVYRLGPRARQALLGSGRLDPLWWTRTVPARFQEEADRLLASDPRPDSPAPGLPPWVAALRGAYGERYAGFAIDLAQHLIAVGETAPAEDVLRAALTIDPEDASARELMAIAGRPPRR